MDDYEQVDSAHGSPCTIASKSVDQYGYGTIGGGAERSENPRVGGSIPSQATIPTIPDQAE